MRGKIQGRHNRKGMYQNNLGRFRIYQFKDCTELKVCGAQRTFFCFDEKYIQFGWSFQKRRQPNKVKQLARDFSWKLLYYIISLVLIVKDQLLEMFFKWYFGEKKACPPLKDGNQFLAKSATELATAIRNREITSTQLIEATINRIKEVNTVLNAIVDGPFTEALEQAKVIDERIANKQISEGIQIYHFASVIFASVISFPTFSTIIHSTVELQPSKLLSIKCEVLNANSSNLNVV